MLGASPVEKYITFGLVGSWQIDPMAMLAKLSLTIDQLAGWVKKFVVFHNPPAIPAAKTVLPVASEASTMMARIRPDVYSLFALRLPLLGPTTSYMGPRAVHA